MIVFEYVNLEDITYSVAYRYPVPGAGHAYVYDNNGEIQDTPEKVNAAANKVVGVSKAAADWA